MKKVERSDLLDYVTYTEQRSNIRAEILSEKDKRRIHLGDHLTFLFENTDTVRYQVQEMMRVERIVKEEAILHELNTYNGLLGEAGELGCSLLIEFIDPEVRDRKLAELVDLPKYLYLKMEDGTKAYATYDATQVADKKVSSVQFLKFKCPSNPVKIGCDHSAMTIECDLSPTQKVVLSQDLH